MAESVETFNIYDKDDSEPIAVKEGWSWPACFFTWIWASGKGLWLPFFAIVVMIFIYPIIDPIFQFMGKYEWIVLLVPNLIFGSEGNEWFGNKLIGKGYQWVLTTDAKDSKTALNEYRRTRGESQTTYQSEDISYIEYVKKAIKNRKPRVDLAHKKSTPVKPLPSKQSSQTLFIRQKREINRKLKQKLITKRSAESQMKKAVELEEMRLIIENKGKKKKVKKVIKPKKPIPNTSKDFEYVEKLKDIKALREDETITQAEFRKLKKKIIDSL